MIIMEIDNTPKAIKGVMIKLYAQIFRQDRFIICGSKFSKIILCSK